jgi:prevent-host-death family protein
MIITQPVSEARANMSQLIDTAISGVPVVLTRTGRPVAVVVPIGLFQLGQDVPADASQVQPV